MALYLSGYGNLNYKSLGGEGVNLEGLQEINVIIGQNNGGKTNILRSLNIWESSRRGSPVALTATDYFDNDTQNSIEFEFTAPDEKCDKLRIILDTTDKKPFVRLKLAGENTYDVIDSFIRHGDADTLRQFCNANYSGSSSELITNARTIENQAYFKELFDLPPIVFIEEKRVQATAKSIRERLEPIWNHGAAGRSMQPIKKALREFIEEGVESKIDIQFEPGGESFSIAMTEDDLVTFDSLGSGFRQIFNLALTIASTQNSIVLIDEPEINMHPSLLRRVMRLIFSNTSNQYIISTHSNVLLDALHKKSIYRVKGGKQSSVSRIDSLDESRELLDDLGVKASELLQTNGIIWVEGPSDRTYIKKWLELIDSSAEEGLDYAFQYYGGKLLAHYTVDDDVDEFINILDINKNAFIVMDSDWKDSSKEWTHDKLSARKQRAINAADSAGVGYWVTKGVEIENYIPNDVWTRYAGTTIALEPTENITEKVSRYKIKAKQSHIVSELLTKESLDLNEELKARISEIKQSIEKWNQQK